MSLENILFRVKFPHLEISFKQQFQERVTRGVRNPKVRATVLPSLIIMRITN